MTACRHDDTSRYLATTLQKKMRAQSILEFKIAPSGDKVVVYPTG